MSRKADLKGAVYAFNSQTFQRALDRYNSLYNDLLYYCAIGNSHGGEIGIGRRNLLIDDAMAICGSPYHRISRNNWPEAAWKFLAQFTLKEKGEK